MPLSGSLFDDAGAGLEVGRSAAEGAADGAVEVVAEWFHGHADLAERFSGVFRQSFDEVLDGQRTGRFDVAQLEKTEKTYLGTKVEILTRAAFGLAKGARMDYLVAGVEVDAKFTVGQNWAIPREALGHVCLLMRADDARSCCSVGLIRITEDVLRPGGNQDGKRGISKDGQRSIRWLIRDGALVPNLLLGLDAETRLAIFAAGSGQQRTNELFRRVQHRLVRRETVLTVARQSDAPKRVRDARLRVAAEGIVILGHQENHPRIARDLGLEVPPKGSWISARLAPAGAEPRVPTTMVGGTRFRVALPDDVPTPLPSPRY